MQASLVVVLVPESAQLLVPKAAHLLLDFAYGPHA
jgi:hypothetical protein